MAKSLKRAGFKRENTGGGCMAWVKPRRGGGEVVVGAADGSCGSVARGPVEVAYVNAAGGTTRIKKFRSVATFLKTQKRKRRR